ncbi:helix-turn-helix domain-containing protein [Crossiella sp. SN42]|uniref:helix-turn-helix domain-containing protein n=1 Tax=Crossiella sp. SN42 TaxID=2944808 RepID=UPI00207C2EF1|nr:helix-turn-helix domain-containing protein [Crossiella sp. SN42]MCO1574239.1 helix-turn-helix domain-containing protein [Crossiella sp. SN42]
MLEGTFVLLAELARLGEAGPAELAAATGLPKATAHRLLVQLLALGAVQRRSGRYRMGPRMAELGQAWQPDPALRAAAEVPLRQLATAVRGERISVAVVAEARARDLAIDHAADLGLPVSCMAAPIRDRTGGITALLGVVVLDQRNLRSLAEPLRRAAAMVSARLRAPGCPHGRSRGQHRSSWPARP